MEQLDLMMDALRERMIEAIDAEIKKLKEDLSKGKDITTDKTKLQDLVCKASGKTFEQLYEKRYTRDREFLEPRQVHIAMLFLAFNLSDKEAGKPYNKDRTTVHHCVKAVNNFIETEEFYREKYREVFEFCLNANPKLSEKINLDWIELKTVE